jgi:hypothetical protein
MGFDIKSEHNTVNSSRWTDIRDPIYTLFLRRIHAYYQEALNVPHLGWEGIVCMVAVRSVRLVAQLVTGVWATLSD